MMSQLFSLMALPIAIALGPMLCIAQTAMPAKQGFNFDANGSLIELGTNGATTVQPKAPPKSPGFHFDESGKLNEHVPEVTSSSRKRTEASTGNSIDLDALPSEPTSKKPVELFGDLEALPVANPTSTQNSNIAFSVGNVFIGLLLAFACCYSIFWVLGKNVQGSAPIATGRRWMNWAVLIVLIQPLTKTFSLWLSNSGKPGNALAIGVLGAVVVGIAAFAAGALWAHFRHRKPTGGPPKEIRPARSPDGDSLPVAPNNQTSNPISPNSDETFWEAALAEFDSGERRPGLWAKMFSAADGNESLAKARYLQARVTELEGERQALANQQAREARQKARDLELANLSEEERAEAMRPKGMCPNCDAIIPLATATCPRCRANFRNGTTWEIVPLPGT